MTKTTTMTNGQIVMTLNTINKIKEADRKLPIKLAYAINKNIQTLANTYKPYEESLKERGLDNLTPEKLNSLPEDELKDFAELYSCKVDVDLYKVKFADIENADLTINELDVIQTFMLEEDEETEE